MAETPLHITGTLHVTTLRSTWLIRSDSYIRMPRHETPRARQWSLDGALDDGRWTDHDGVWLDPDGLCLRILPSGRPLGSVGIYTGTVLGLSLAAPPRRPTPAPGHHDPPR